MAGSPLSSARSPRSAVSVRPTWAVPVISGAPVAATLALFVTVWSGKVAVSLPASSRSLLSVPEVGLL